MIKKALCLLLTISLILPLVGCWNRKELSELAIVLAAGLDSTPQGNIVLTIQIARPNAFGSAQGGQQPGGGGQQNNVWVLSQEGETVMDAIRYLETKVSRHIYWGHTVILVIGEQLAKEGIRKAINFFSRSPFSRETIWVMVARGQARDVLNSHSQLENTSAQSAGRMIRAGAGMSVMLKDLSMMLASKGTNPVLPRIELTPSGTPQGPEMAENIPEAEINGQERYKIHAEATLTGTAVFDDDRLVGWLNVHETRGLLWLLDQITVGEITVPSPVEPDKKISIDITRGNTRVEPFYDGQDIWFDVHMDLNGALWEQQSTEELTDEQIFAAIEKSTARIIEACARSVIEKAKYDYGVDIFGFGEAFHRKYKDAWPALEGNWNEAFVNAGINIKAEATIRRTGLVTNRISKE
ncbi:Ger(x)C family spore germination protein [Desulfallas thermosapovorans]|uniref:Spore germination protein KC n=1 Tax=Desulfallas thermosapovorans DSM 6562 TaxID=1121431 RepID=A0A5S4ZYT8_9FIRM|nr:Ger(x)C family spore germination protein [Desulfallas thermosapovorans]TYO97301.1 spore germination protein KC [Desulfallas thermosapovorans DSM 6562]